MGGMAAGLGPDDRVLHDALRRRGSPRHARPLPVFPGASGRMAAFRGGGRRRIPVASQGTFPQGGQRGETPHLDPEPKRSLPRGMRAVCRPGRCAAFRRIVPFLLRPLRQPRRPAWHGQFAGPGRPEVHRSRGARLLPGQRDLGFQPGRSRQPQARRFPAEAGDARRGGPGHLCDPPRELARRRDQDAPHPGPPAVQAGIPAAFFRGLLPPGRRERKLLREHVLAFVRERADAAILVAVPHVAAKIGCPAVGSVWDDTRLAEPESASGWRDILTGRTVPPGEPLLLRTVFAELPFAVLQRSKDAPQ